MQAGRFISLVKNVTDLRPEELNAAQDLAKQYPYSQLLHLIIARASRDQKASNEKATLNRAAIYATDRTILKDVMTRAIRPRVEAVLEETPKAPAIPVTKQEPAIPTAAKDEGIKPEPVPVKAKAPKAEPKPELKAESKSEPKAESKTESKVESRPEPKVLQQEVTLEGDALRNDLEKELSHLRELMGAFDATYEKFKKGEPMPPAPVSAPKATTKKITPQPTPSEEIKEPTIVDAPLIEEIKTSKRKPKIVSPKVAEQGEIIDQFIKVAPTLPRTKPTEPPTTDLAEDSVNIADNIVSETLVEILLKQGKKAKAIEMLKKLIWKFPQKKAYFAAQIEALKS